MAETPAPAPISPEDFNKAQEKARSEQARAVDLEKRLEAFKGIDPEAHKAMKEELEISRRDSAAGDPEKIKVLVMKARAEAEADAQKRYGKKIEEYEGLTTKQAADLRRLNVILPTMQKAAALFTDDSLKLVEREIADACDLQEGIIVIKGADGKPAPSKKDPRQLMSVDEYLESFAAEHPSIAKSNATGGAMKAGTTRPATGGSSASFERYASGQLSREERLALDPKTRAEYAQKVLANVKIS